MAFNDPFLDKIDSGRSEALHNYLFNHPDISNLRNNPKAILQAMTDFKKDHHMMTFNQAKLDVAQAIIEEKTNPRPKVVIELGTYVGYSAIAWGKMVRTWSPDWRNEGCKVVTMEASPTMAKRATDHIDLAGLGDTVEVMSGLSSESLRTLKAKGIKTADMLFLDHWEKSYVPDLRLCEELRLLKVGTIIIADNTDMPGAPDYLAYVRGGGEGGWKYDSKTYDTPHEGKSPSLLEVTMVISAP